ncbi:MAG: hypothetical protein EOM20_16460 [Spartobacteria bacterium]|nr:hypothetical protein [Spartobacteria bacterium]
MKNAVLNVFMFHRVYPGAVGGGLTPDCFQRRVAYIQRKYRVLDGGGLVDFLDGAVAGRGPFAALTFDDGWLDNWLYATPVLRALDCPAILALSTGYLHDGPARDLSTGASDVLPDDVALKGATYAGDFRAFLNADEIKAMVAPGRWSVQAHGQAHVRRFSSLDPRYGRYPGKDNWSLRHALDGREPLPGLPTGRLVSELVTPKRRVSNKFYEALRAGRRPVDYAHSLEDMETEEQWAVRLRSDLERCTDAITRLTNEPPQCMFWPWGHHNVRAVGIAREIGLRHTFGVHKGRISQPVMTGTVLPRISVSPKTIKFIRNNLFFRHPVD